MNKKEQAYWLADKISALGDYAKEAAFVLGKQADEIETLQQQLAECQNGFETGTKAIQHNLELQQRIAELEHCYYSLLESSSSDIAQDILARNEMLYKKLTELESQKAKMRETLEYYTMGGSNYTKMAKETLASITDYTAPPTTQASVEAAYLKAAEVCNKWRREYPMPACCDNAQAEACAELDENIRALSGTDALREFGLKVAEAVWDANLPDAIAEGDIGAIVDRVIEGE